MIKKSILRQNPFAYRQGFRQFNRRNNDAVAAMYELYLNGKSLQYIAEVLYKRKFTRQSLYDVFRVRGYKLRSKKIGPVIVYKGNRYTPDRSNGAYRMTTKRAQCEYLLRNVWEDNNGTIPKDFIVFPIDGNYANYAVENIRCMHREEAKKLYNYANQNGYKRFQGKGSWGV